MARKTIEELTVATRPDLASVIRLLTRRRVVFSVKYAASPTGQVACIVDIDGWRECNEAETALRGEAYDYVRVGNAMGVICNNKELA